jgi:hypothetical protein
LLNLIVTILLALIGYLATYFNNLRIAERKDRLDRINRQLSELYGPLLALVYSSESSWKVFRSRCRPGMSFFGGEPPPSEAELAAWRLWMTEVFMPLNLQMEKVVTEHADLLDEVEMPQSFLDLCAHISSYKAVLKKWEMGDFSEHKAVIKFPKEILEYTTETYQQLKFEQTKLLGGTSRKRFKR